MRGMDWHLGRITVLSTDSHIDFHTQVLILKAKGKVLLQGPKSQLTEASMTFA